MPYGKGTYGSKVGRPSKTSRLLTIKQREALKRHSKKHTKKHMNAMKKEMRAGKTFSAAHTTAMKKVGV
tara:strand:- start:802 stop:1008 length:207 start_codon:yes stop_codon:yes gene_type:complete